MKKTLLLTAVIILAAGLMFAWAGKETGVNSLNSQSNVEVAKVTIPTTPNPSADGLKKEAEVKAQIAEMEAKKAERAKSPASEPTLTSQSVIAEPAITKPAPGNLANSVDIVDIKAVEAFKEGAVSVKNLKVSPDDQPVILYTDISEIEPNDVCADATPMACDNRVYCGLLTIGTDDHDYFVFTLSADQQVTIETHAPAVEECTPDNGDTFIELWDEDCVTMLASDQDGGDVYYSKITMALAAGEYVIHVNNIHDYGPNTGYYHLTLDCINLPLGACCVDEVCVATNNELACNGLGGNWYAGEDCFGEPPFVCPAVPANDLCENAEAIVAPYPATGYGTCVNATVDCPGVLDWTGVWYTIELPYASNDITINLCGEGTDMGWVGIVLMDDCACDDYILRDVGAFVYYCDNGYIGYDMTFYGVTGRTVIYWPAWVGDANEIGIDFSYTVTVTDPSAVEGACCVDEVCVATETQIECEARPGTWFEGETCPEFDCPAEGFEDCPQAGMWENGEADLVNGTRPTVGWDDTGIIEDFTVTDPTTANCFRVEFLSVLGPALPEAVRIRVYNMPPSGSMADLDWAVDGGNPLFDYTYAKAAGELTEYDTGVDAFGYDLVYYDCCADEILSLTPGNYVFFVTLPGYGANGFWATAPPIGDFCYIWGVQVPIPSVTAWHVAFHIGSHECQGEPPLGACCVEGQCVATNTLVACDVLGGDWYAGEDCFGTPPFDCPGGPEDPCEFAIYNNGGPFGASTGTQCDPYYPMAAGVADDFELGGTDPIILTEVVAWIGHWNATPLATPADWEGVNVTIYAHDPTNNQPGGQPIHPPGPDCAHQDNMPPDGIVYTVLLAPGSFSYTDQSAEFGGDCWMIQMPVTVTVNGSTMYWLEVQPILDFASYGQTGWIPTDLQTGAFAMQAFELLEIPPWTALLVDMAFCLNADEAPEYCESWGQNGYEWITNVTIGDINNTTGAEPTGYGDYTALSTVVTQGWSHNLSVSFVNDGDECIRAWIDWDQNWTFDADELYEVGFGYPGPFDLDITVPMEAALGETRMRVQDKWATCGEPCETDFWGETEDYTLVVEEFPCDIECVGTDEGEPICFDGYDDNYNAGCNMLPDTPVFGSITCGETICGTSGTHLDGSGAPVRDTDWFEFDVTVEQQFTLTVEAEFPVTIGIIVPGFDDLEDPVDPCSVSAITYYAVAGPCQIATVQQVLGVGEFGYYWVWIGPQVGAEVECGKEYAATLTCAPPPTGACCIDFECVATNTETECLALSEWGDWHEGETCPEFVCPVPLQAGLATTQNIPDCGVSNFGPIGETESQGNTYGWNGNTPKDFAGTFVMGNAPDMMFSVYNTLPAPPVSDCYQYTPTGVLDMTDTFHPTAPYSDGAVMGGVSIEYCGHGFTDPAEAGDIFVHVFTVTNVSGAQIADYYAGMYIDWDVAADDDVTMDIANNLIYQTDALGATELYGICLINGNANSVTAVSQEDYIYPTGPSGGGWTMADLHHFMSTPGEHLADAEFTDMSQLISAGPYTLEDGESVTIQIACIGAPDAGTMVARAQYAVTLDLPVCELGGPQGYEYLAGDVNMALGIWPPTVIGGDVTYLVGYFIGGGQASCLLDGFWCSADINGDCVIIGGDVTALVGYFVAGGALVPCPDYPSVWPPVPPQAPAGWPNCDVPVINVKIIPTGSVK